MCRVITAELEASVGLSLRACCSALDVARTDYYRFQATFEMLDEDLELRDHIQKVALERPSYGYRRITKELKRQGREVRRSNNPGQVGSVLRLLFAWF